jgi:hypothetical protein
MHQIHKSWDVLTPGRLTISFLVETDHPREDFPTTRDFERALVPAHLRRYVVEMVMEYMGHRTWIVRFTFEWSQDIEDWKEGAE